MILQSLDRLRQAGCEIEQQPALGLQLDHAGLGVWSDYLQRHTPLLEVYQQIGSTQDALRRLIESVGIQADGAVTIADIQTAGRGRLGRSWIAPPGSCLLFSRAWVGRASDIASTINRLTFSTAVAVAVGIEQVTGPNLHINIKWPNDLLIDGRKLAGILVETVNLGQGQLAAMIGVGININIRPEDLTLDIPSDVADQLTSLFMCGQSVDRLQVLDSVLQQMNVIYQATDLSTVLDEWRQRSQLIGQEVRLQNNGQLYEGQVVDLDLDEGLILRTETGTLVHLPAATTTIV